MGGELHSSLCMSENLYFTLTPVGTLHADLPPERFPFVYAGVLWASHCSCSFHVSLTTWDSHTSVLV